MTNTIDAESAKFWANVNKHKDGNGTIASDGTICWTWKGATDREGYGRLRFHGKQYGTHQVALMIANNLTRWPSPDMLACHKCDNPPCCRPSHLFFGSVNDNNQDARAKGHFIKKLDEAAIARAKVMRDEGYTQAQIARELGVDQTAISKALRRPPMADD